MNDNGQTRAKAGGELGINGEWYEGGKFLPNREDRPKTAPPELHILSAEEQARRVASLLEREAAAERIRIWEAGTTKT